MVLRDETCRRKLFKEIVNLSYDCIIIAVFIGLQIAGIAPSSRSRYMQKSNLTKKHISSGITRCLE